MSEFDDMKGGDDEDGGQVAYDQDDDRSESDFSDSEDPVRSGRWFDETNTHGTGVC